MILLWKIFSVAYYISLEVVSFCCGKYFQWHITYHLKWMRNVSWQEIWLHSTFIDGVSVLTYICISILLYKKHMVCYCNVNTIFSTKSHFFLFLSELLIWEQIVLKTVHKNKPSTIFERTLVYIRRCFFPDLVSITKWRNWHFGWQRSPTESRKLEVFIIFQTIHNFRDFVNCLHFRLKFEQCSEHTKA